MTVLVTGATGLIGGAVVDALLEADVETAVVTRDPGAASFAPPVEVRRGDITRPAALRGVLAGVDRMFLFPLASPGLVDVAREAGVRHVVLLSSMNAAVPELGDPLHPAMERAVEGSGMTWTHLRPGEFAHNKLRLWGGSIRHERIVRWPDRVALASAPVHERDVAEVAVAALLDPARYAGRALVLTGPERLSVREQVGVVAEVLDERVTFVPTTVGATLDDLGARGGWAAAAGRAVLHLDGPGSAGTDRWLDDPRYAWMLDTAPDAAQALGHPGRSFREWVTDHLDDFR